MERQMDNPKTMLPWCTTAALCSGQWRIKNKQKIKLDHNAGNSYTAVSNAEVIRSQIYFGALLVTAATCRWCV